MSGTQPHVAPKSTGRSPAQKFHRSEDRHLSTPSLVFGSILLAFVIYVFVFAPKELPEFKQRILAFVCAMMSGLFGYFMTGDIGLRFTSVTTRAGKITVRATGGMALFVLVLWWWLSPAAPIKTSKEIVIDIDRHIDEKATQLASALGLSRPNLEHNAKDPYRFFPIPPVAGHKLEAKLTKRNTGIGDAHVRGFHIIETYESTEQIDTICDDLEQKLFEAVQKNKADSETVVAGGQYYDDKFSGRELSAEDVGRINDGSLGVYVAEFIAYPDRDDPSRNWRLRKRITGNNEDCAGKQWRVEKWSEVHIPM